MKKLVFFSLFVTLTFAQQRSSYSWEDGTGTILGFSGNVSNPENVGTTSGISPYHGSRMLTVSESPLSGTPEAYVAFIENLDPGDVVTASFYGWDENPNGSPSLRAWGWYVSNGDINDEQGSAGGGDETYTSCDGCWDQVEQTWTIAGGKEALRIEARLYSSSSGPNPQQYFIDLIEITAPNGATVNYPGSTAGCMDASACNYNPYATEDDGSCIFSQGSISIYDIQYTTVQGDYCYESIHDQECWTTSGTVSAHSLEATSFYLQDTDSDSYAGIHVHDMFPIPNDGEDITLTAMINEHYSNTQLLGGTSFTVNSSGNSVEPTDITTGDLANGCTAAGESVEGMLVRVSNVSVTTESNEYGEWYVNDNTGDVLITHKTGCQDYGETIFDGEGWPEPNLGQEYASIVGVVDYAYSSFRIIPRKGEDIALCPTCPIANAGDDQLVLPGTVGVTLDGSSSYDPNGTIIAYEWTQLSGTLVTLSDEEAVSTTFTAPETNGDLVFRLTVWDNDYIEATDKVTITIGTGTPIQDIQCPSDLTEGAYCYETSMAGDEVSTYGIVAHVLPVGHSSEGNFFLQQTGPGCETCAGIFIRDFDIVPSVGDELTLTGTVNEYYSFTQIIDVTSASINTSGNCISPLTITTATLGIDCSLSGHELEGMLIRVENVTVEDIDEFGNIQINDGSGPTLMDDYYFDGQWQDILIDETISSIVGVVGYSYSEFKLYPRNQDDFNNERDPDCCPVEVGDLNGDTDFNILDIVTLANCVLAENCGEGQEGWDGVDCGADLPCFACAGELNGDFTWNVLDIVQLALCVLAGDCGGRVDDASEAALIKKDNLVSIEANGFIGGVQMTLSHGSDLTIKMTDRALLADYLTTGNETRLLVISPETEELFSFTGEFEITEVIVANSQYEVSVDLPLAASFRLSDAYPNPFNPVTTMTLTMPMSGEMTVEVYNLLGQVVATLASGYMEASTTPYTLTWDASNASSGVYFVQADAAGFTKTQKLMLIK